MTTASFRLTEGERHIFRKRERLRVSDWAVRNIIVQDGPYAGSRLRLDVSRYLVGMMDAFGDPHVEEIICCGGHQLGKTLFEYICLGYSVDNWPGTKMLAMPSDEMLARVEGEKLKPLLMKSPGLRKHVIKHTASHFRLLDGSSLFLSSAASPSQRASITVKHLFLDEEDQYKIEAGKGLPVEEFKGRTRSYSFSRKIVRVSKPVGDESSSIWRGMMEADELRVYEARCPACGSYQEMKHHQVVVMGGEKDPRTIVREKLGRYRCEGCKYEWSDHARDNAVAAGRWRAKRPVDKPRVVGFHLPALLSHAVSLSEIAAKRITAKRSGSHDLRMDYYNGDLARPCLPVVMEAPPDAVLSLVDQTLPPRTVPAGAAFLTAGVDTQLRGYWFLVAAWSSNLDTCWVIDYGQLPDHDSVRSLAFLTRYPVEGGGDMPVHRTAQDTGGGEGEYGSVSMTERAYQHILSCPPGRLYAVKGAPKTFERRVIPKTIGKLPTSKMPIPGGLNVYFLDTGWYKSLIHGAMRQEMDKAQALVLHNECGQDLADHLTSERQVLRKGRLAWEKQRKANHLLDCLMGAWAAASPEWAPSLQGLWIGWKRQEERIRVEAAARAKGGAPENPYTRGKSLFGG